MLVGHAGPGARRAACQQSKRWYHGPIPDTGPEVKAEVHEKASERVDTGFSPRSQPDFLNCYSMNWKKIQIKYYMLYAII